MQRRLALHIGNRTFYFAVDVAVDTPVEYLGNERTYDPADDDTTIVDHTISL